jgi:hypothetical protein
MEIVERVALCSRSGFGELVECLLQLGCNDGTSDSTLRSWLGQQKRAEGPAEFGGTPAELKFLREHVAGADAEYDAVRLITRS